MWYQETMNDMWDVGIQDDKFALMGVVCTFFHVQPHGTPWTPYDPLTHHGHLWTQASQMKVPLSTTIPI